MNQPKPEQEPSMEEILASIRRIISEDGEEGDAEVEATAAEAMPEPAEAPPPLEAVATEDDVLELPRSLPRNLRPKQNQIQNRSPNQNPTTTTLNLNCKNPPWTMPLSIWRNRPNRLRWRNHWPRHPLKTTHWSPTRQL